MQAEFRICTLASGSSGNAVYAECAEGAVLIDAGLSGKRAAEAIRTAGGHIDRVDALIVTHDHSDHSRGAGILSRRHGMPLLATEGTACVCASAWRKVVGPRLFRAGSVLSAGGFHIHTCATPHDAAEPVALVLERNGARCGILTDLGHPFAELRELLSTLDAAVLESNHDPEMLRTGPYPPPLKARIRSPRGHISNDEAAELVRDAAGERLRGLLLAHLSETNNTPAIAAASMDRIAGECLRARQAGVAVAPRYGPSAMLLVRGGNRQ